MSTPVLMYHDVAARGREDESGFRGGDAARYKLTPELFERHLDAIAARVSVPPLLTFDDGGVSAAETIAGALERHGWRGHFFVTTGCLGRPEFLDEPRLRELRTRGHAIGGHSHTHPLRMAAFSERRLREEWSRCTHRLADILGEPITTASIPGGHYSEAVAATAGEAGITTLFTSRPTTRVRRVNGVSVIGRYAVYATTAPQTAAGLVAGDTLPRAAWIAAWSAKQVAKAAGRSLYLRFRARALGASSDVQWGDDLATVSEDTP